jgi:PPOX class probable F420-dependent enzyme
MAELSSSAMPTVPAPFRDLLQTDVAILSTNSADGYPQTTALWFLFDDDGLIRLSLNTARQKTKNLQRDPQVTLFVLDRANPMRSLEIRARAAVTPDPDYAFADRLAQKYGGVDLRQVDGPGERRVVVTLHPVRVNAADLSR